MRSAKFSQNISALMLLAMSLNIAPAWSQNFTPPKLTTPTITIPTVQSEPSQVVPNTAQPTPKTPTQLPTLNLPVVRGGNVILPTDTLPWSVGDESGTLGPTGDDVGGARVQIVEFTDLNRFLAEQGWTRGVPGEATQELDEESALTVDTDFADSLDGLIPISYTGANQNDFVSCACPSAATRQVIIRVKNACPQMSVFTNFNQFEHGKVGGAQDGLLYGEPGTVISNNKSNVTLHKGQLVVDAGSGAMRIASKEAGIKLGPQSTAAIDYRPGDSLSIRALSTVAATPIKVRLGALPDRIFELKSGEELSINLTKQDQALLESIVTSRFSLTDYAQTVPRHVTGDGAQYMHRLRKHLFSSSGIAAAKDKTETTIRTSKPLHLLALEGSRFIASNSGKIGLLSGSMLVKTEDAQIFRTKLGDVYMQPGALASLQRWQGELRVECCSDPKSTILVSDNFGMALTWGTEGLIVDHPAAWSDALPNDGIGRRRFEMHALHQNNCVISDFSIPSLLLKSKHLQQVRTPVDKQGKELHERLLKTAAALQVVTARKGGYYVQPPKATAQSEK